MLQLTFKHKHHFGAYVNSAEPIFVARQTKNNLKLHLKTFSRCNLVQFRLMKQYKSSIAHILFEKKMHAHMHFLFSKYARIWMI